jgi:predicted nucleic acid-binding protein
MPRRIVVDASVLLRLLVSASADAARVIRDAELAAPGLIVAETAHGLVEEVRLRGLPLDRACALLREGLALPIEIVPDSHLAEDALAVAAALGLTAYDAGYVVLARRLQAPLVTADRRLADAYPRAELID